MACLRVARHWSPRPWPRSRKRSPSPRHEAVWRHATSGLHAAVEPRHAARVYVNDANTDAAAGYTIGGVRFRREQQPGAWRFREFIRIDSVTNRRYAGSVIVAEARSRFFEPAPGRNWLAGMEASYSF